MALTRASRHATQIALALALAGCARRTPPPSYSVPVLLAPPDAGLSVTLGWDAPVDLDLYVTDPSQETFYFANRGEVIEHDTRCADLPEGAKAEHASWSVPVAGRYRVGVDFPEACGDTSVDEVAYRLVIAFGTQRETVVSRARRGERVPRVREFEVARP